uniref:Uncharacterized protein n=1 Tax=Arundo donax TaxID=35708 RepID=A0A0A9E618_ARUDO
MLVNPLIVSPPTIAIPLSPIGCNISACFTTVEKQYSLTKPATGTVEQQYSCGPQGHLCQPHTRQRDGPSMCFPETSLARVWEQTNQPACGELSAVYRFWNVVVFTHVESRRTSGKSVC